MNFHAIGRWFGHCCGSLGLALGLLAAGCGGGGSDGNPGTVSISVSYAGDAYLFQSSVIKPALSGFEGHDPKCSLSTGRLPAGMSLRSDCSISGTPDEMGDFAFTVRVGASGVSNTLDFSGGFKVWGPSVLYDFPPSWNLGETANVAPMNVFWFPASDTVVTYDLRSGSLPNGLSLDTKTGRVSGTVMAVGTQSFRIGVTASRGGKVATLSQDADVVTGTHIPGGTLYPSELTAWLGKAADLVPAMPTLPGTTFSFAAASTQPAGVPLPQGLALSPSTGRITGTPTRVVDRTRFAVSIGVNANGVQSTQVVPIWIEAKSPLVVTYGFHAGVPNGPIRWSPEIYSAGSDVTPSDATFSFGANATTPFPPGLSVDPISGDFVGQTPSPVEARFFIDVHVMLRSGSAFDLTVPIDLLIR